MEPAPPRKIPYAKPLAIALAAYLLYALLGFFAGPPLVKRLLSNYAAETLQRKLSIGEARVNPLLFSVELKDFALTEADGAPIVAFKRLFADFELSSLARLAWTFSAIEIEGLDLRADIAPGGRFNLLALLDSLQKTEAKPGARPPRALLHRAALTGGAITFSDRSLAEPASAVLAPIDLEVHDLSTIPDALGTYSVSMRLPEGGRLQWQGEASLQPLASKGRIDVAQLKPAAFWRFLQGRLNLGAPAGEFDAGLRYAFAYGAGGMLLDVEELQLAGHGLDFSDRSRATPYRVQIKDVTARLRASFESREGAPNLIEGIAIKVTGLEAGAADAAQPMGTLDTVELEGGRLDLAGRRAGFGRVAVGGGELRVVREKDGSLPLLKILSPSDEGLLRREIGGLAKEAKAEGRPWSVAADEITVNGTNIALSDLSFGEPLAYDVRDLRVALHGLASDGKAPVKFDAALRLEQGGTLSANGEALLSGEQAELRAKLERINLTPLQPALATRLHVKLASGDVSADVKAAYRLSAGKHGLRLGGTLRVDNFLANEAESGERLLAWKSLAARGLSLGLEPDQLKIEEATLEGLGAKIVVFQDRSTNLGKAVVVQAADEAAHTAKVTVADTKPLFPVTIARVRMKNGIVDFADQSLVLPFGAKVEQAAGLVEGISTDRASRAAVKLEGRVGEFGLARAEGSLETFRPTDFMDLGVIFRNVDMPPLSPYSATFAGRRIASGKLSLDLKYKIDKGRLAGDNRVLLEKFTLGEKVESPGALQLPLDLAIALLTDSDGKIDISVPVTGDVNDPQFGYGTVIWQAIKTVIGSIVSAPFRALASLFGGGSTENLESIVFDPGRAALLPPEQEKLKHVAEGLAKRPQIRLVAEGQTGPADRAALQRRDVARAVNAKLGREPAGADPDPVNVADAKAQRALEALFAERQSEEALAKFAADTAKARGQEVDRVNAALALVGRASADRAFYEALLKRLQETAPVTDAALAQLAEERASAVTAHLVTALALPAERATTRAAKAPGEAQVKLELDLAAK